MHPSRIACVVVLLLIATAHAETYKELPPAGIPIDAATRQALTKRVSEIQARIDAISKAQTDVDRWRPDVEVLVRAVRLALDQNLFFKKSETEFASELLDEAARRLPAVENGQRGLRLLGLSSEALQEPQLLVGGFRSTIDDSVQPYGLVVPAGYSPAEESDDSYRVDVWLHGRGDTKTEVPFLHERMTKVGQYSPVKTFVLHPFGRHCNAFKFAGETDVYESLDHLSTLIQVDTNRIAIRGFSMGGAGCWHLAVHNPGRWFAANPGAGFVDTIVYQGWTEKTPYVIDSTRKRLMNWYDVLPWVSNLSNTRTVAYSGEVDKQRQGADRVVARAAESGIEFPYVIGKKMGHKIDSASASKIDSILDQWATSPLPSPREKIDFVTYTLRYNGVDWLEVTGLEKHWSPSRIQAKIVGDKDIEIATKGITRFEVDFRESAWPNKPVNANLLIDGQAITIGDWDPAPGIQCELRRVDDQWSVVEELDSTLRKRPGLQGPIDDAFCGRFLFVAPSRPAMHGVVQRWIDREFRYAQKRWSRLMRGEVRVVKDTELTEEQIKNCHLICFGDYTSNQYLRGIADRLPIQWTRDELKVGTQTFNPNVHAAAFCFPNPRNPQRYLVVNSGMTFREFSNVSNSRQIPMLGDWSVLNVSSRSNGIFAATTVGDGFFDEQWSLKQD